MSGNRTHVEVRDEILAKSPGLREIWTECALCGHSWHEHFATAEDSEWRVLLCHEDDHSCYERWTVWGDRPQGV